MFKKLFSWVFPKKKSKILKKSAAALNLFHKAVNELENVNESASEIMMANIRQIEALSADNDILNKECEENKKIISNIKSLILK